MFMSIHIAEDVTGFVLWQIAGHGSRWLSLVIEPPLLEISIEEINDVVFCGQTFDGGLEEQLFFHLEDGLQAFQIRA